MEFTFTAFAAVQIAGAILMRRYLHHVQASRARVNRALRGWVRNGDVYFTLDVQRFGR